MTNVARLLSRHCGGGVARRPFQASLDRYRERRRTSFALRRRDLRGHRSARLETPLIVRTSSLHQRFATTDLSMSSIRTDSRRPAQSTVATAQRRHDRSITPSMTRSRRGAARLAPMNCSSSSTPLDDDERARLGDRRRRALRHVDARARRDSRAWKPRSSVRATQRLAGGNVVLARRRRPHDRHLDE